ncbi:hypothetical protein ACSTJR_22410 [Vibrio parahaemolyticus]
MPNDRRFTNAKVVKESIAGLKPQHRKQLIVAHQFQHKRSHTKEIATRVQAAKGLLTAAAPHLVPPERSWLGADDLEQSTATKPMNLRTSSLRYQTRANAALSGEQRQPPNLNHCTFNT